MQILVDADAFPGAVRDVLFRAVERRGVKTVMVSNTYMRPHRLELVSHTRVGAGPDEADDRIVELAEAGDLVVTADIPLADRVVRKGAFAINPRGELYTEATIKQKLATRDLMECLRNDGLVSGGPAGFRSKDVETFANSLDRFLTKHCRS